MSAGFTHIMNIFMERERERDIYIYMCVRAAGVGVENKQAEQYFTRLCLKS